MCVSVYETDFYYKKKLGESSLQLSQDHWVLEFNFKIKFFFLSSPFFSTANNQLPIDQYFVCIQKSECDTYADIQQNELAPKSQIGSNLAIKKTENNIAAAAAAIAAAEMTTKDSTNAINDMETLFWHTHGCTLWQHWIGHQFAQSEFYIHFCSEF